jgi:hypothetical protein
MPDLERMRQWADAAAGHPTWSVAYAEDVPVLLAEIERLRALVLPSARDRLLRKAESDLTLARAEAKRLRECLESIVKIKPTYETVQVWAENALKGALNDRSPSGGEVAQGGNEEDPRGKGGA